LIFYLENRLPELDSAFWGRLEIMCSENQSADEWIPVFISLLEVTRDTIHVIKKLKQKKKIFEFFLFLF